MNTLQQLTDGFINNTIDGQIENNNFIATNKAIYSNNNEPLVSKIKNNIFIEKRYEINAMNDLLNCFDGIVSTVKNNTLILNGIEWDGSKTNIELFL